MALTLTKHVHSLVRLDDGDARVAIDPGTFSDEADLAAALDGVDAVLITHEHADHVSVDALRQRASANSSLQIWCPPGVARMLDLGGSTTELHAGDRVPVGGFDVEVIGGHHAVIHPLVEPSYIDNLGLVLTGPSGGTAYHPGDALYVPERPVDIALVPVHAPWSKVSEVLDLLIAVQAPQAHPIHDGLLNERGLGLVGSLCEPIAERYGTALRRLEPGESTQVAA